MASQRFTQLNFNNMTYKTTTAIPEAASMIETFRAIGYSFETAVADIIDNSISAGAKNIWLSFDWRGNETTFLIKDDGFGMDNQGLIQALTPGSKNPNDERDATDLGRFGLGLKTASFSQCRYMMAVSKKANHEVVSWTWDLDHVQVSRKWELIGYPVDASFRAEMDNLESGTMILWKNLDRMLSNVREDDKSALRMFLESMEKVKRHVAMVFHRYISGKGLKIWFQDKKVEPWDPFLSTHSSTQRLPEEPVARSVVRVKGFVLPHKSKLDENEFREAAGLKGWNAHQGFYIYRKERLLVAGDWFGMFRKEEHHKLARIQLDLPNDLDADWQIDIKKSVARPPLKVRDQLKQYANKVRSLAVEVYRHKGKVLQRKIGFSEFQPLWNERSRGGKRSYEINLQHPLVAEVLEMGHPTAADIRRVLRFVEETVPVPLITIRESEEPEMQALPFEGANLELVKDSIAQLYRVLTAKGNSPDEAIGKILGIEPFNLFPEFVTSLKS
jgi:hypothetical protein